MCTKFNFHKKLLKSALKNCFYQYRFINYSYNMNKAYLRRCDESESFQISFEYKQQDPSVQRVFNFSRKLSEEVNTFLNRVQINVDKAVTKKNKKKKSDNIINQVHAKLIKNDIEVLPNQLCGDVFLPHTDLKLCINNTQYNIVVNSPWIEAVNLPDSVIATYPVYPIKFEAQFVNKDHSDFIWYKSKDKKNWEKVGDQYIYVAANVDINQYLKLICIPRNEGAEGPAVECVASETVQASPGECPFEKRHAFTEQKATGKEFRVVSYNLLADLYCDSDYSREVLFPYCPPYALNINYRKLLVLKEIIGYNADLICLQEVDRRVYNYDLQPILSHLNFEGSFNLKGGEVAEGLAIFYNKYRFILLDSDQLVFSEKIDKEPVFADIWNRISTNPKLAERIKGRTTTLQISVLGSLEYDEILLVGNIHLYFHPDADHIRLLHACLAIKYLESVADQLKERYPGKRVSLIFCGDFNSVPNCGIYKLFTTGSVPGDCEDYSSNEEEKIENIDVHQKFELGSACGTPKYTNFTVLFADCLDYIYYEKTSLKVTQVVPLPSVEELTQNSAIPSIVFPSDHIALVSDLKWL